jgi:hypothetical protein
MAGRIRPTEKSNDIRNQTNDLLACSMVPQPTMLLHALIKMKVKQKFLKHNMFLSFRARSEVPKDVVMKSSIFWDISSSACYLLHVGFSFGLFFGPQDGGDVSPKHQLAFNRLHGTISQKTEVFFLFYLLQNLITKAAYFKNIHQVVLLLSCVCHVVIT